MNRLIAIGAVGLAALAGAAFWLTASPQTPPGVPLGAANAQEAAEVDTSGVIEMTLGNEDAKVTVIEYASFTCPHCATFHLDQAKQLKRDYVETGKVKFILRDVYFDRYGLWASMIARCDPNRYWGITDMLYSQQKEWLADYNDPVNTANAIRKIGKVAGLSEERLEQCLNDQDKAKALVAWYQQHAEADGLEGTPSLVINGQMYENMSYAALKDVIDEKLAE